MLLLQLFTHLSWLTLPALARPQSLITDDSVAVSARELQVLDSRTVSKPLRRREKIPTLLLPPDLNLTNAFNQTLSPPYAILNGKRILGVPDPKHGDYVKYLPLSYPDEPITFDKHFPIPLPIPFIGDAVDLEIEGEITKKFALTFEAFINIAGFQYSVGTWQCDLLQAEDPCPFDFNLNIRIPRTFVSFGLEVHGHLYTQPDPDPRLSDLCLYTQIKFHERRHEKDFTTHACFLHFRTPEGPDQTFSDVALLPVQTGAAYATLDNPDDTPSSAALGPARTGAVAATA